jgi:hypothetical protein
MLVLDRDPQDSRGHRRSHRRGMVIAPGVPGPGGLFVPKQYRCLRSGLDESKGEPLTCTNALSGSRRV